MAKKSSSALLTPEPDQDVLVFDAAEEFMSHSSPEPLEDVQAKVKEAQEELLQLRLRQEEIERQKQHFEMIRQKQERFARGKRELVEKFNQASVTLESELYNSQKLVEELSATLDTYTRHLDALRAIQPEKWQRAHVDEELDRAIATITEAESDYSKCTRRLTSLRPVESGQSETLSMSGDAAPSVFHNDDLKAWAKRGFAFTLPLMAAMLAGLILARILF